MSFPDIDIPWIEQGRDYCILRVNRTFDGTFEGSDERSRYLCEERRTERFGGEVAWRITASPGCDESDTLLPSGFLAARGTTFLRDDGFAHYMGQFVIKTGPLPTDVTLFHGILELIGNTGSHQFLNEACNERGHVEGWLIGRGVGPAERYTLRVVVVAEGTLEPGTHLFGNAAVNRLTGTLIREA